MLPPLSRKTDTMVAQAGVEMVGKIVNAHGPQSIQNGKDRYVHTYSFVEIWMPSSSPSELACVVHYVLSDRAWVFWDGEHGRNGGIHYICTL